MVVDMEIKRLKNTKFGTSKIARVVTGWALYEAGKGWIAFSSDRDQFGDPGSLYSVWRKEGASIHPGRRRLRQLRRYGICHRIIKGRKALFFYTFPCIIENISFCF